MSSGGGRSEDDWGEAADPTSPLDERRYRVEGPLGEGGMGEVLRAWDAHLGRAVALKRLRPDRVDPAHTARLLREARLTAHLDHPGVVPALDVGRDDDGRLFYTMRLVRGRTLGAAAVELPLRQLLRHLLNATHAVAHAHANGVVHRDLKPDNVMVGPFGETRVVDWGLACRVGTVSTGEDDDPLDLGGTLTRVGGVVGTPGFMSPEQARGEPVGPPTDVYALGQTLRDLLRGRAEPELYAIAERATRPDPAHRYPDAAALSEDLEAWLDDRPVSAYRYSLAERVGRAAWRWRSWIGVGASVLALVAVGLAVDAARVVRERDRALAAEAVATSARRDADLGLASALAREAVGRVHDGLLAEAEVLAAHAFAIEPTPRARGVLMAAAARPRPAVVTRQAPCDGELLLGPSGWGCLADGRLRWDGPTLEGVSPADAVWLAEDGVWWDARDHVDHVDRAGEKRTWRWLGTLRAGPTRALWWRREEIRILDPAVADASVRATCGHAELLVGWGPGEAWAACYPTWLGRYPYDSDQLEVFELPAGRGVARVLAGAERGVAVGMDERLLWLDRRTGELLDEDPLGLGLLRRASATSDGRFVWVEGNAPGGVLLDGGSGRRLARLGDAWTGAVLGVGGVLRRPTEDGVRELTLSPGWDGVRLDSGIASVDLSPDGSVLALGDAKGTVHLLSVRDGAPLGRTGLGGGLVKAVAFTPDGASVVASAIEGAGPVRLRASNGVVEAHGPPVGACRRVFALRGGEGCLPYGSATPIWWDGAATRRVDELIDASGDGVVAWALSAGGEIVRIEGPDRQTSFARRPGARRVHAAAERVVVATADGVELLDLAGETVAAWPVPEGLQDVALSPGGEWVAAGFLDGTARVWSAAGELLATLEGVHEERVANVVFGRDLLVTTGWDGRARLWGLGPLREPPAPADVERAWQLTLADVSP
ncbi:MAG: protein kinase [Alphaproteobacteria bacterium]|nr:protein kinase [Alphaproteobacteria bacterium]